jgi:hypothetical protein
VSRSRLAAAALWIATAAGAVALVGGIATSPEVVGAPEDPALLPFFVILVIDALVFATVAVVITNRRPDNVVGWLLAAAGLGIVVTFSGYLFGSTRALQAGEHDVAAGLLSVGAGLAFYGLFATIACILLYFPDGRLPSPRWRWPVRLTVTTIAVVVLGFAVQPGVSEGLAVNPLGIDHPAIVALGAVVMPIGTFAILFAFLLGTAALAVRFRRSRGSTREQMKWLLASSAVFAAILALSFASTAPEWSGLDVIAVGSLALVPISIGIAVLRYRLYEIDRIISRTIAYAVITAALLAVYAALILVLQGPLGAITGGDTLSVALSTLAVAALFQPVRRRTQRAVDRRFNRARYDLERTVSGFASRLRDDMEVSVVASAIVQAATRSVEPTTASVWLRSPGSRS